MPPLGLSDDVLREILIAALPVAIEHRGDFLAEVIRELQAQPSVGPGNAHRIAHAAAKRFAWDAERLEASNG